MTKMVIADIKKSKIIKTSRDEKHPYALKIEFTSGNVEVIKLTRKDLLGLHRATERFIDDELRGSVAT